MANFQTLHAEEEGSYIITVTFTNEDGGEMTPATLFWKLTKLDGSVVNSLSSTEIETPAASNDIALDGDDLALDATEDEGIRVLTVWGTYVSNLSGDLTLKFSFAVRFTIDQKVGIT